MTSPLGPSADRTRDQVRGSAQKRLLLSRSPCPGHVSARVDDLDLGRSDEMVITPSPAGCRAAIRGVLPNVAIVGDRFYFEQLTERGVQVTVPHSKFGCGGIPRLYERES